MQLDESTRVQIFISHASRDSELVEQLQAEVLKVLPLSENQVFATTRPNTLSDGDWLKQIIDALNKTKIMIPVMTPCAIKSPWVHFEYSYVWKRRNVSILPLYHPHVGLPSPLNTKQGWDITGYSTLEAYFNNLCKKFRIQYNPQNTNLNAIIDKVHKISWMTAEESKMQMEAKLMLRQAKKSEEKQVVIDWMNDLKILQAARLDWISDLDDVKFPHAYLYKTNLGGNSLRQASFYGADMEDAILGSTRLQGADFTMAKLRGVSFAIAMTDQSTILPDGKTYSNPLERWECLKAEGVKPDEPIILDNCRWDEGEFGRPSF